MTPAPQHCAHECELFNSCNHVIERRENNISECYLCINDDPYLNDIRCTKDTRKAAAIAEHDNCNNCAFKRFAANMRNAEEHDAQVRKDERGIMAKALTNIIKREWMCDLAEICYIIECVGNDNCDPFKTMRRGEHQ